LAGGRAPRQSLAPRADDRTAARCLRAGERREVQAPCPPPGSLATGRHLVPPAPEARPNGSAFIASGEAAWRADTPASRSTERPNRPGSPVPRAPQGTPRAVRRAISRRGR
jgi:hypothetical protein